MAFHNILFLVKKKKLWTLKKSDEYIHKFMYMIKREHAFRFAVAPAAAKSGPDSQIADFQHVSHKISEIGNVTKLDL